MSQQKEIRALVIDYGEVLSRAADPVRLDEMARAMLADPAVFAGAYWKHRPTYDRGEVDGPSYWRRVAGTAGVRIGDDVCARLVAHDIELWTRVDDRMLEWANAVAASGVPVGLLSNMVPEIGAHLRDTLRLFESFTSVTYSYEVGLAKPAPGIYHRALEGLGVAPEKALFVDDREANVDAARAVGMHVHHFQGHDALLAEIETRYAFAPDRA